MSASAELDHAGFRFLEDVLVLEYGSSIAAGACGTLLAELGATVIVVEPIQPAHSGKWANRAAAMAGKESVFDEEGRSAPLIETLRKADIVLLSTDFDPQTRAIWEEPRPKHQVICDLTSYGHSGPLAGQAHSEALVQAVAGIADTTGNRNGLPTVSGAPFVAMETAVYAVAAILAALQWRRRSGDGQRIDMALYDVAVNALLTFIPLSFTGRSATRNGNRHPTLAPWNAYRASDGWVMICGPTNDQWRKLCAAMKRPELVAAPLFATPTLRFENVGAVDEIVGAWVADLTVDSCVAAVLGQGIPCSPILDIDELATEPNLKRRSMVATLHDPVSRGMSTVANSPVRITSQAAGQKSIPLPGSASSDLARVLAARPEPRGPLVRGDRVSGDGPLAGLRVVEIGMNTVAPLACRQLGALGADVIKVEPPAGDSNRINVPLRADQESYIFALSNTDKRGVVLDLKERSDAEALWRLIAKADVIVENLKPGSLSKLGFGASSVHERYPEIIYCSVNGFGYDTAYPGRPALDTVIQAMSGAMSVTAVDGVPTKMGISISDQLGGQFGLVGILAALEARVRTGKGLHLDIAMQDCSVWATQTVWNRPASAGSERNAVVPAADGHVLVEGEADRIADFLACVGGTRSPSADLVAMGEERGIAIVQIQTVDDVIASGQTAARSLLIEVPTVDGTTWRVLGSPLKLCTTPAVVRSAMPALGFPHPELVSEFGLADLEDRCGPGRTKASVEA